MFEKKSFVMKFYRKKLNGLLALFTIWARRDLMAPKICWDETRNEWKLTIRGTSRFEWAVKVYEWIIDKMISLAEKVDELDS